MGWVAAAGAALSVVSSIGQSKSAKKAAGAQMDAAQAARDFITEQYEAGKEQLDPYTKYGEENLRSLQDAMNPLNRQEELSAYYASPEYKMLADQARGQQLAAAEATGGLGSTANANSLAAIAPQLGMNYLGQREQQRADLFNRLFNTTQMGFGASQMQAQMAQNYGAQIADTIQQKGAAQAGRYMASGAPWGALGSVGGSMMGYGLMQGLGSTPAAAPKTTPAATTGPLGGWTSIGMRSGPY